MPNTSNMDFIVDCLAYITRENRETVLNNISTNRISNILDVLLDNRGISLDFFNNFEKEIISPYELVNAKEAADLICKYLNNKNALIYIYADYDCDGINAGYVLYDVLRKYKANIVLKYPNRNEGYGLSMDYCNMILDERNGQDILMITVDNGITKTEEVKYLKENGVEVIVTDHHLALKELPPCLIVDPFNPEGECDKYKHLSGCGVAFKVAELVQHNYNEDNMYQYTANVALSILSDVMPMSKENMAFLMFGFNIINGPNCPEGLEALKKLEKVDMFSFKDLLWSVNPIINACGRMGDSEAASRLFLLDEYQSADEIAQNAENINAQRKKLTKEAVETLSKMTFDNNICLIDFTDRPQGLLGILAGKAQEMFNKPSVVYAMNDAGICHGSLRSSINVIPLFNDLKKNNIIIDFAGHANAGVVTFDISCKEKIEKYFNEHIDIVKTEQEESQAISIDFDIDITEMNKYMLALTNLIPYDCKEISAPNICIRNCILKSLRRFKSGYTELRFQNDNAIFEASIYGDMANKFKDFIENCNEENVAFDLVGFIQKRAFFSSRFQTPVYTIGISSMKRSEEE